MWLQREMKISEAGQRKSKTFWRAYLCLFVLLMATVLLLLQYPTEQVMLTKPFLDIGGESLSLLSLTEPDTVAAGTDSVRTNETEKTTDEREEEFIPSTTRGDSASASATATIKSSIETASATTATTAANKTAPTATATNLITAETAPTTVGVDAGGGGSLEGEFRRRREHLQQKCRELGLTRPSNTTTAPAVPLMPWVLTHLEEAPGPLIVCVTRKGGSTSWRGLAFRLRKLIPSRPQPVEVILVRHPLARLASAYRDKYLGGLALSGYTKEWIQSTGSTKPWLQRWRSNWLPLLIFLGHVTPTLRYSLALRSNLNVFNRLVKQYTTDKGAFVGYMPEEIMQLYGETSMETMRNMVIQGRQYAFEDAIARGFTQAEERALIEKFTNASFSFVDFVRFVIWTHESGVWDLHWTSITETCNPCLRKYQYIMRLENIVQESRYLLQDLLGFPDAVHLTTQHRTKGSDLPSSDLHYYKDLPPDLLPKILQLFKYDFELFGYNRDEF